jgi:hypothetical protein
MTEPTVIALAACHLLTLLAGFLLYRSLRRELLRGRDLEIEQSLRGSVTDLLAELEASTERAAQGITRQRVALTRLLRDADRRIQLLPDADGDAAAEVPAAAVGLLDTVTQQAQRASGWQDVAVQLAEEGIAEVAIARRLKVGLEEVRLTLATRMPGTA